MNTEMILSFLNTCAQTSNPSPNLCQLQKSQQSIKKNYMLPADFIEFRLNYRNIKKKLKNTKFDDVSLDISFIKI